MPRAKSTSAPAPPRADRHTPPKHTSSAVDDDAPPADASAADLSNVDLSSTGNLLGRVRPETVGEPVQYGGRHPDALPLLERLTFPPLAELEVMAWVAQALRDVTAHRQGAVLVGNKGVGKTEGRRAAEAQFHAREQERRQRIPGYVPQQLRIIGPVRPTTRVDLVRLLYEAEMGTVPPRMAAGGADLMLGELVEGWREDNVAALVFDEADHFGAGALEAARDIIARAEDSAGRARATAHGAPPESGVGRPRGIGVLLMGIPEVADRLRRQPEWGQRWRRLYRVDGLTPALLPDVYRRLLPACAREAGRVGDAAWALFIQTGVAPLVAGAIRRVEGHLAEYVTLWSDTQPEPPATLDAVGFDETLFLEALETMAGSEGGRP